MIPVVSFVGSHNSGKTTLLVQVVKKLSQRGIKAAVIKHAAHGLDTAVPNDSNQLFNAGAQIVYAASPDLSLLYRRHDKEPDLDTILVEVSREVDLIITEGFKKEPHPKIQVLRQEVSTELLKVSNLIARVADFDIDEPIPLFNFKQDQEIADFIIAVCNLSSQSD